MYAEVKAEPKCWNGACKNSAWMFPGLDEWLAFWVFVRFSSTAERIGVPKLLELVDMEDDLPSLELLMVMDGWYAEFSEKYKT